MAITNAATSRTTKAPQGRLCCFNASKCSAPELAAVPAAEEHRRGRSHVEALHRTAAGNGQAQVAGLCELAVHALALGTHHIDHAFRQGGGEHIVAALDQRCRQSEAGSAQLRSEE